MPAELIRLIEICVAEIENGRTPGEDHVVPRFLVGRGLDRKKLLAHCGCNSDRGYTAPSAEFIVYAATIHARLERYQTLLAASAKHGFTPPGTQPTHHGA